MATPTTYSLFELQNYIRRVIAANLNEAVWITAEVAQCGLSKGHWYIDLIEKQTDSDGLKAQSGAVLWATAHKQVEKKIGAIVLSQLLQAGVQLRLQVVVDFHERYGMKLVVQDIDAAFTFGQMELQRRAVIAQLQKEGLWQRNKKLNLPLVVQRVAVVSSPTAAGYQDFIQHLLYNNFGIKFEITLFEAAVQGVQAVAEISTQLLQIANNKQQFDAVCVLRGGGSRIDLAAFDDLALTIAIAKMPLPVLTGIGHETDESIADMLSHTPLKTPTAVADFLIERVLDFWQNMAATMQRVGGGAQHICQMQAMVLERVQTQLQYCAQAIIQKKQTELQQKSYLIARAAPVYFNTELQKLIQLEREINFLRPERVFERGFSMVMVGEELLTDSADAPENTTITVVLKNGRVAAVVK